MKKLALTFAIVLSFSLGAFAQGGLFQYGDVSDEDYYGSVYYGYDQFDMRDPSSSGLFPKLPSHGVEENQNAPLGSGALLLIGFGAAYAAAKRRKE